MKVQVIGAQVNSVTGPRAAISNPDQLVAHKLVRAREVLTNLRAYDLRERHRSLHRSMRWTTRRARRRRRLRRANHRRNPSARRERCTSGRADRLRRPQCARGKTTPCTQRRASRSATGRWHRLNKRRCRFDCPNGCKCLDRTVLRSMSLRQFPRDAGAPTCVRRVARA